MLIVLFGKPLVFWLGALALLSFSLQIYLGLKMVKGRHGLLKYHKLNAFILCAIVFAHLVFALFLYRSQAPAVSVNNGSLRVAVENFSFSPTELSINFRETVTWTNQDSAPHQISGNGFKSDVLDNGQSFNFTFNTAGTYDYVCPIHPYMKGKIIVK